MMEKKIYLKDESHDPFYTAKNRSFLIKSRIIPLALILSGLTLLTTQVAYPLIFYQTTEDSQKMESSVLGLVSGFRDFEFEELPIQGGSKDLPDPSNNLADSNKIPEFFLLSIPKLNIEKALVKVNSPTLNPDEFLGHYNGSALPGQTGNSFIFGHSVLPWFYNPKNYKTIFSTLDLLEVGDSLFVEIGEKKFTYIVEGKESLKPLEVNPLKEIKPKFLNESTLTLMTCTPPGTKLKRLLVYAVMK